MKHTYISREVRASTVLALTTLGFYALSVYFAVRWLLAQPHVSAYVWLSNSVFLAVITAFAYGNLLYQLTRIGYYRRLGKLSRDASTQRELDFVISGQAAPQLSVLIPSYKEELVTVMQTVVSAALIGYPHKDVSLLLDDPKTEPGTSEHNATQRTLRMMKEVQGNLSIAHRRFDAIAQAAQQRLDNGAPIRDEQRKLAETYQTLAKWFHKAGASYAADTHTDTLFIKKVFTCAEETYLQRSTQIMRYYAESYSLEEIAAEYAYISGLFATKLRILQRKQYANLSQEPNKAMNINSYISLMGDRYEIRSDQGSKYLQPNPNGTVRIPSADYVITLDADSLLDHSYAATLIHHMEQPGNERVAVAQTPYSAIRGTDNVLERTAGATTDIQYIIHQGFTAYGATYWVGANALIRFKALQDIAEEIPGQTLVRQYIQDRTVIEDTESSIDLIQKGWTLYNHPERLAYSATPNDYGSLLIQRRRWANGGIIILPKLLLYLVRRPTVRKIPEGFMRIHYLASIAAVNVGLVLMLCVPLGKVAFTFWVPLTAVPYFLLYDRDLRTLGYDRREIFRVYALNLLLIPINLGGVLKSIEQLITKKKIPFGRTPKIGLHTAAPALYHLANVGIAGYLAADTVSDILLHRYAYAALLAMNTAFFVYALVVMVGVRSIATDIRSKLRKKKPTLAANANSVV